MQWGRTVWSSPSSLPERYKWFCVTNIIGNFLCNLRDDVYPPCWLYLLYFRSSFSLPLVILIPWFNVNWMILIMLESSQILDESIFSFCFYCWQILVAQSYSCLQYRDGITCSVQCIVYVGQYVFCSFVTSLPMFANPQMNSRFPDQISMPDDFSCVWDNRPSTKLLAPSLIVATFQVRMLL